MREPSPAETARRIAQAAVDGVQTILPGIVQAYNAALCEVDVIPAIFADDETAAAEPYTCPLRVLRSGGFGVGAGPLPGDHCTLVFHGLDPSAFFAAPGTPARAELTRRGGVYPEAWPALYAPLGPPPGGLWLGTQDWTTTGININAALVQLGGLAAADPAIKGTALAVWVTAMTLWAAGHTHIITSPGLPSATALPPPPPDPGLAMLSTKVMVA